MGASLSQAVVDDAASNCRRQPTSLLNTIVGTRDADAEYSRDPVYEFAIRLRDRLDPNDPHYGRLARNIRISEVCKARYPRMSAQQAASLYALIKGCPFDGCADEARAFVARVETTQGLSALLSIAETFRGLLRARTDLTPAMVDALSGESRPNLVLQAAGA